MFSSPIDRVKLAFLISLDKVVYWGEENIQAGEKLSDHLFHTNVVNILINI